MTKIASNHLSVCVVVFSFAKAFVTPLSNLDKILCSLVGSVYIVAGEVDDVTKICTKSMVYKIRFKEVANNFIKVINYAFLYARVTSKLIQLSKNTDVCLFFGQDLLLPIVAAKLWRRKVVLVPTNASGLKGSLFQGGLLAKVGALLSKGSCLFSNLIVVYSSNIVQEWNLQKYQDKIIIAHEHFLDFNKFKVEQLTEKRKNLIGYIGRLSEEKGVINFIEAIPKLLENKNETEILIGGDGQLRTKVEQYLNEKSLNNKAKFIDWIPHDELPKYLNELKLLVIPSYTEGLPNIMLEAMACGTPVLATPVGAIPDLIKDGETGFIMGDNSPECIAKNVIRVLNHLDLDEIAKNARELVEKEFTYEAAVEMYKKILKNVL